MFKRFLVFTLLYSIFIKLNANAIDTNHINIHVQNNAYFPIISEPLIKKDKLFFMDGNGNIYCINQKDSSVIWKKKNQYSGYLNGGISSYDEKLYVTYGINLIECIDEKTGNLIWKTYLKSPSRGYPNFSEEKLFLQTMDKDLYAIAPKTGKIIWRSLGLNLSVNSIYAPSQIFYKQWALMKNEIGNIVFINKNSGLEDFILDIKHQENNQSGVLGNDLQIPHMAIHENHLYFYSNFGNLYKFDLLKKTLIWSKYLQIDVPFYIEKDKLVAISNTASKIYLLDLIKDNVLKEKNLKNNKYLLNWGMPIIKNGNIMAFSAKNGLSCDLSLENCKTFNNTQSYKISQRYHDIISYK